MKLTNIFPYFFLSKKQVRPNNDGTYSANWTPGNIGFYQIHVSIDGCEMPEPYKVEVRDPPQGVPPPHQQQSSSKVSRNLLGWLFYKIKLI